MTYATFSDLTAEMCDVRNIRESDLEHSTNLRLAVISSEVYLMGLREGLRFATTVTDQLPEGDMNNAIVNLLSDMADKADAYIKNRPHSVKVDIKERARVNQVFSEIASISEG